MTESLSCTLPLRRWQGDRRTYHLVTIGGETAEAIAAHALMHRLEFGIQRGFGSVKVMAEIGCSRWKTSVFPQREKTSSSSEAVGQKKTEWVLLVSKKVMRAEDLAEGDPVALELELL
ncbi:DUF1905 domain-containing protein [Qipengyuania gelatinilytica]|uniref:DUF1905 domain-containing protein n=1 Tax=Qipengyuania gelatinilytica TaxID=2867231 RepID=A0ABX9A3W2_9SPHN|nr:DUF1905 domain-containing protein [Qipengyuania gelatinilytica]QZD94573.1 DUF1905 domain-containing protein [Qipengyuania gelatinilytica]